MRRALLPLPPEDGAGRFPVWENATEYSRSPDSRVILHPPFPTEPPGWSSGSPAVSGLEGFVAAHRGGGRSRFARDSLLSQYEARRHRASATLHSKKGITGIPNAEGRSRTDMDRSPLDFESSASTNFTTPA